MLLLEAIFFVVTPDTILIRWHHPHASEWLFHSTCDLYSDSHNRLSRHHADMLLFIKFSHCHHHRVLRFYVV